MRSMARARKLAKIIKKWLQRPGDGPIEVLTLITLPKLRGPFSKGGANVGQDLTLLGGSFCDLTETLDEDSCEGDLGIPDMKLIEKIVSQVEFYLSDENLSRDAFLLKHVQKNKFGFVSIKLLTSFKKMKSLTRDWRQTLYALQFSDNLEVNEEETKVRRKTPVPNSLLGLPPTKLLLAWNLDCTDKTSLVKPQNFLETATSLFASFGILTSVRILKPGKEVPSDVKKYLARYPELATKNCALVEYENLEGARKALETFSVKQGATNGDNDVKVVPVSGRGTRKKSGMESDETENCDLPDKKLAKQHGKLPVKLQYTEDASCCSSSESDSTPASPILAPRFPCVMNFASPDISFNPSSFSSPRSSPLLARKCFSQPHHSLSPLATDHGNRVFSSSGTSPEKFWRHPEHSNDSGICSSSWVQRRKAAAHNLCLENKSVPCSPLALKKAVSHGLPSGILRLPHGPDGSRGFHNSISRGKLVLRH